MGVGLEVGKRYWGVGSPSFFNAFFSTVFVLLEQESWGSEFPTLMKGLYGGRVEPNAVGELAAELREVRKRLGSYAPHQVIWDFEDRSKVAPWGDDIDPEITSLADYFVTSDGEDLFTVFDAACSHALAKGSGVSVK